MSKSPSLRRIQADIRELALDPSDRYHAAPLENDMFEWHFTIRGADDTDFESGVYHGRIMLPPEYPFKPPHVIFLTPSGRFETNTKICLSFTAFHPELWNPSWGIRLILEALISFLPTPAEGAIGALDWTSKERQRLAKQSVNYFCPTCGCKAIDLLPKLKLKSENEDDLAVKKQPSRFQKEIEQLRQWQSQEHAAAKEADERAEKLDETRKEDSASQDKESRSVEETPGSSNAVPNGQTKSDEASIEHLPKGQQFAPAPAPSATLLQEPEHKHEEEERRPETNEPVLAPLDEARLDVPPRGAQQQAPEDEEIFSWLGDPLLHGIIVLLAIICFLLMKKLQTLTEELRSLGVALE